MEEQKFTQILEKNNEKLMQLVRNEIYGLDQKTEKRFTEMEDRFTEMEERFVGLDQKMEKRFAEVEQRRIDDNFYFEHKYWDKISIIFDKLKLNDDIKKIEEEKNLKLQQKVENNSAKLMSLDFRVSQLERNVNSK